MFLNSFEEFVICCSRKVYKFNHCNLKGYEEVPTVHDFTSNNFIIVDDDKSIIGGTKNKFITKVNLDMYNIVEHQQDIE